jgi:hypothetical protein
MNEAEFTKDLYKLYVSQRKKLDESVPVDVKERYINKQKAYEVQKVKQKEKYHKRVAEEGDEYRKKLREVNKANEQKRKARKQAESSQSARSEVDSRPASPISRYAESMRTQTQTQKQSESDDDDLESVFSEDTEPRKNVFNNFIGF